MTSVDVKLPSLTSETGRAVSYRLVGNAVAVLMGLAVGVILARLLPPVEFGMFGVAAGIVFVMEIIGSCGMQEALVQRKMLSPEDEAAGALVQMAGAMILGGGLIVTGPRIEKVFGMPGLGFLVQLQSVVLLMNALGVVPTSRLTRRLAFDRLAAAEISTRALGGIVSILLALRGMGALSLIVGSVTAGAFHTCLVWTFARGRIPLVFRVESVKNLVGYGTGILFSRASIAFARRIDVLIIGHRLGPALVGLYQRGFQLVNIPLFEFANAVSQVLFPAMASVQDADWRFRRGYLGSVGLSSMVAFPLLTLLWTTADPLIPLLYGPMWTGTVPILMSLGFVGYLRVVNNPNGMVAKARGRSVAEATRQAIVLVSTVLFVFLGTSFGIQGAVLGVGMASLLSLVIMTRLAISISGVSFFEWLGALRTTVVSSAVMALAVLGTKAILGSYMPAAFLLVAASSTGILVYILSLRMLLTREERQTLEQISRILPARLSRLFHICIGLVGPPVPGDATIPPLLLTEKPNLPKQ